MLQPVLLVALQLTGKQVAAVRCFYGYAVLPGTVTIGAGGQAGGDAVAVIFVPQEHFTLRKGVLENTAVFSRLTASVLFELLWYG